MGVPLKGDIGAIGFRDYVGFPKLIGNEETMRKGKRKWKLLSRF